MKRVLTKAVVTGVEYTCDMLFKKVEEKDVHKVFSGGLCISKEAYSRLPQGFQRDDILESLLVACGSVGTEFTPEMLAKGVWLLSGMSLYAAEKRNFARHVPELTSWDAALAYIDGRYKNLEFGTYYVFVDGKYKMTCSPEFSARQDRQLQAA